MRVYLAAVSGLYSRSAKLSRGGDAPLPRVLTSFLPNFKDSSKLLIALDKTCEPKDYCVDSGAHVWLAGFFKHGKKPPVAEVERFMEHFCKAIEDLPRKPTFVVELDLQKVYGMDTVSAWRRDIWAPLEKKTDVRVCYVWHNEDGQKKWDEMLAAPDMRYLGIGGKATTTATRQQMVFKAYHAAKPVHGFAAINIKWIRSIPYYSVDSTSWSVGAQVFGAMPVFNPSLGKIDFVRAGNRELASNPNTTGLGLIKTGFYASDVLERGIEKNSKNYSRFYTHAAKSYDDLEKFHTAYWVRKGIDWEAKLKAAGNLPAGTAGGHGKPPR